MEFLLFILVNAALFIRPSEVVEALRAVPVYNILILLCLAASIGPILALTSDRGPRREPSILCVLVILIMIVASNVARGDLWTARSQAVDFLKVAVYYLLLLASLRTPARLVRFLTCLAIFTLILSGTSLLHYHHVIQVPSLEMLERMDDIDSETGESMKVVQLIATGIYSDPNDLCTILVVATLIALYRLCNPHGGLVRLLWLGPIAVYLYALILTQSRGGLLALMASLMTLFLARFGWRRSIPLAVVALPAILMLSGGRQTRLSTSEGTAQGRMMLWIDGIRLLSHSPILGIGAGQ
ncbi:MAG: O-antigen ligase family protein, partial [Isosphaeraceae bacterium]